MLWAAISAAAGLRASRAEAMRLWVWNRVEVRMGSGLSATAESNFSRKGGSPAIRSARRLIRDEIRSMPLR